MLSNISIKRFITVPLSLNFFIFLASTIIFLPGLALSGEIISVEVKGNAKVEDAAILQLIESRVGTQFSESSIKDDIINLYDLGFFSEISFLKKDQSNGKVALQVVVKEKPAIASIDFTGLDEVSEEDVQEKINTRLYTIVNEAEITADLSIIEKLYAEKGFFLAKATYSLKKRPDSKNEVDLVFNIDEQGKVMVSQVEILGNEFFSDSDLLEKFMSRPVTRASTFGSTGVYGEELVKRDAQFLSYYYQDFGFAKVNVGIPTVLLSGDRNYVDVTFTVEEGIQYKVGSIDVTGDVLYEKSELFEWMKLKPGEIFSYSRFQKDIEMLVDKYGDLGYAYVDPNPKTRFNDETKTVDLNYEVTKGEKVYFGLFDVIGNTKTRDNVIRREFEVADGELYSGTRLRSSKQNVQRLGFFEEVQFIKERDEKDPSILNYKIKVKEKPTGQLQAALGYSPSGASKASWFGQGRYDEKNQHGKGWATDFSIRSDGNKTFKVSAGFSDPRVNDSYWSLGTNVDYERRETSYVQGVVINETRKSGGFSIGRRVIELIRASISFRLTQIEQDQEVFILNKFRSSGLKKSLIFGTSRRELDNYLDPTEGSSLSLRHKITGGPLLGGDFRFMETTMDASYYYPIDFSDTYRTHFKLFGAFGKLWSYQGEDIPLVERYRLGGPSNLRGFDYGKVSPSFTMQRTPDLTSIYYFGGDKQLYFQLEYFMPLIPEAGIKALFFADAGRVYSEEEEVSFSQFKRDIGYGFRWITPIAPFRFEFAYPIEENGSLGDAKVIFNIGY